MNKLLATLAISAFLISQGNAIQNNRVDLKSLQDSKTKKININVQTRCVRTYIDEKKATALANFVNSGKFSRLLNDTEVLLDDNREDKITTLENVKDNYKYLQNPNEAITNLKAQFKELLLFNYIAQDATIYTKKNPAFKEYIKTHDAEATAFYQNELDRLTKELKKELKKEKEENKKQKETIEEMDSNNARQEKAMTILESAAAWPTVIKAHTIIETYPELFDRSKAFFLNPLKKDKHGNPEATLIPDASTITALHNELRDLSDLLKSEKQNEKAISETVEAILKVIEQEMEYYKDVLFDQLLPQFAPAENDNPFEGVGDEEQHAGHTSGDSENEGEEQQLD